MRVPVIFGCVAKALGLHVNCPAVGNGWVLAGPMRYDGAAGFAHGGAVCASVTTQLINPALA